jgi:2-polyprenyl-3-methyl-5-hydroxy-6-metoxy-1,4-benzoquinol methylase
MATYQAVIDINNKNNSHTHSIDFIREHPKNGQLKILDLGCSEGYLGEYLKSFGHTVVGVEINKVAADRASKVLDRVFCGSILKYFSYDIYSRFDIIILGDVLEHTENPREILEVCQGRLLSDGLIIISLPNVSHFAVRAMLLDGRWDYSDLGILDKTHLRFFTKESALRLFNESGLLVRDIKSVRLPTQLAANMCGLTLRPELVSIVENTPGSQDDGEVFQYVFKLAVKPCKLRVVVIYSAFQNTSLLNLRLTFPLNNWSSRYDGAVRYRVFEDLIFDDFYWGDIFIFHRESSQNFNDLALLLQEYGKRVIFEIDDYLLDPPDFLSHHQLDDLSQEQLRSILNKADAISTTTPRLARAFEAFNKNVFCTPNCSWSNVKLSIDDKIGGQFNLVIASSDTVQVDFLIPVLQQLKANWGSAINFVIIGPPGNRFEMAGIEIKKFEILPYRKFGEVLASLENAIGIIPLDDSFFSSCKSPVKFFDYSLARIPTICSNVPPYSDIVTHEVTGLLVENETKAWVDAVENLMNNATLYFLLVKNACNFSIEKYSPDVAGDSWHDLFSTFNTANSSNPSLLTYETYLSHFSRKIKFDQSSNGAIKRALDFKTLSLMERVEVNPSASKYGIFSNFQYIGRNYSLLISELESLLKPMATDSNFDESGYLEANPDVAIAVKKGQMSSGRSHFDLYGKYEFRRIFKHLKDVDSLN